MDAIHMKCFKKTLELMLGQAGNPYEHCSRSDIKRYFMPTQAHPEYKSIRYSMVASTRRRKGAEPIRVEVVFEKAKAREWNKAKMEALKVYIEGIEEAFGTTLEWKAKAGIKGKPGVAFKVVYEDNDFYDGLQADNVNEVADWLATNMLKLARAVDPYMAKID
jgi:Domain of unknown function (DUF4268)